MKSSWTNACCCRVGVADMIAAAQGDAAQLKRMSFQYDRRAVTCMLVRHYKACGEFLEFWRAYDIVY